MTETNKKSRMVEQDIAKGVAIILVMITHTLTLKREIFLILGGLFGFILPFFFFMAGYNYKPGKYTFVQNVKRRSTRMLIPFIVYLTIVTVISGIYYYFAKGLTLKQIMDIYLKALLTKPFTNLLEIEVPYGGMWNCVMTYWFIQMLFVGSVVFFLVVDRCLSSLSSLISICIGLMGISMIFAHFDIRIPFYINEAPAIASIMIVGAAFGKHNLLGPGIGRKKITLNAVIAYIIFLVFAAMFRGSGFIMGGVFSSEPLYEWNIPLTLLFAVTGSYALVHFCRLLTKPGVISSALIWCGRHTLPILFLHNLVQLFVCSLLGIEPFRLSTRSKINDFRTFGILAIEIAVTAAIIIVIEHIQKKLTLRDNT
ncbi:acyltransferase family protein [Butyrivibrio sp. WCE2006]|uniref:acyltransferase family protein n=1 Tax=Butyrivibrio sp. WCE2006 TaxID=1410611 RepID=UPI0005D1EFAB|nr:acyltransferase family protein [Butyrivibrio sp. WCE2006]